MKRTDLLNGSGRILGSPVERFTRLVFSRVVVALARTLRDEELTVAQIAALHLLDQQGTERVSAIAEAIGYSISATSRMVDDLVRRKLVARSEDQADRRARALALLPRGRALVNRISEDRVRTMLATEMPEGLIHKALKVVSRYRPPARP